MGRLTDLFISRSVSTFVERARRKMAAGKLEEAARILKRGIECYPTASTLRDLQLSVRRARAHVTIRNLEVRIEDHGDPHAYEELIDLYQRLELPEEARRRALAYVENYPDRDAPHLILGSMHLDSFIEDLCARHGHKAHEHLLQAAGTNAMAVHPRMLLAELYFCIGADHSLAVTMQAIEKLAPDPAEIQTAMDVVRQLAAGKKEDRLDGIFERIECDGRLVRAPEDWPLSKRRSSVSTLQEEEADGALMDLVSGGAAEELVVMRRDGSVMSHVTPTGLRGESGNGGVTGPGPGDQGLVGVLRTVSSKVLPQATEFDLGKFRRCTIQGRFGNVVIGRIDHLLVGARGQSADEPLRLWKRVCRALEHPRDGGGR